MKDRDIVSELTLTTVDHVRAVIINVTTCGIFFSNLDTSYLDSTSIVIIL